MAQLIVVPNVLAHPKGDQWKFILERPCLGTIDVFDQTQCLPLGRCLSIRRSW